jgi:hypothetical protein
MDMPIKWYVYTITRQDGPTIRAPPIITEPRQRYDHRRSIYATTTRILLTTRCESNRYRGKRRLNLPVASSSSQFPVCCVSMCMRRRSQLQTVQSSSFRRNAGVRSFA